MIWKATLALLPCTCLFHTSTKIQLKSSPNPGAVVKAVYPSKIFSKELKASGIRLALTLFTLKVSSTASLEVDWGRREIVSMGHSQVLPPKLWYRESKGMSVLGCLTESNVSEMIHTEETKFFSRFEPFQIPEEMGIDVAFQKARIWKTNQKLLRLIELLHHCIPELSMKTVWSDKFWGKGNCPSEQDVLLA